MEFYCMAFYVPENPCGSLLRVASFMLAQLGSTCLNVVVVREQHNTVKVPMLKNVEVFQMLNI